MIVEDTKDLAETAGQLSARLFLCPFLLFRGVGGVLR